MCHEEVFHVPLAYSHSECVIFFHNIHSPENTFSALCKLSNDDVCLSPDCLTVCLRVALLFFFSDKACRYNYREAKTAACDPATQMKTVSLKPGQPAECAPTKQIPCNKGMYVFLGSLVV